MIKYTLLEARTVRIQGDTCARTERDNKGMVNQKFFKRLKNLING